MMNPEKTPLSDFLASLTTTLAEPSRQMLRAIAEEQSRLFTEHLKTAVEPTLRLQRCAALLEEIQQSLAQQRAEPREGD